MIIRDIYLTSYRVFDPIHVVEGNANFPIQLVVQDTTIESSKTSGTITITAYNKSSKGMKTCECTLDDDKQTIELAPPSGFFFEGNNTLQLEIDDMSGTTVNSKTFSFPMPVICDHNLFDDTTEEAVSAQTYAERAEESANSAAASAKTAQEVEESIPDDYTTLANTVATGYTTIGYTKALYVDYDNGSDDNSGVSATYPFKTLGKALTYFNKIGYGPSQFVIYIAPSDTPYEWSYRSCWQGCPHIFGNGGKPTINFSVSTSDPPRFYSCHINMKDLIITSTLNGIYFENCALTANDVDFQCNVNVIGGSAYIHDCTFTSDADVFDLDAILTLQETNASIDNNTFSTGNTSVYAMRMTRGSVVKMTGSPTFTCTETSTKPAVFCDYSSFDTNFKPSTTNVVGFTKFIQLNSAKAIMSKVTDTDVVSYSNSVMSLGGAINLSDLVNRIAALEAK